MTHATLLRGGTVLVHNDRDEVDVVRADVLVRDGIIEKVEADIPAHEDYAMIDCTERIVAPGFVNTHHHLWQTQLKGLHANQALLEYFPCGNMSSAFYEPHDAFYGQLAGVLEALNGGITTTLDYSSINESPQHVYAALQAIDAAGMRVVYGYCPNPRFRFDANGKMAMLPVFEPWVMDTFEQLAIANLGPRTSLGFAFDGLSMPKEMLQPIVRRVQAAPNVRVITAHDNSTAMQHNRPSSYSLMVQKDLLDAKNETHWVLVHATNLQDQPIEDLKRHNIFNSITPASELSMGMGTPVPVALNREHDDLASQISIGIDCHAFSDAFIPSQLRSQLFAVRQYTHAKANAQHQWYASMDPRKGHFAGVQDAFNLATIGGARALGMEREVGRIQPGYRADLVLWETRTPSMIAVAEQDPVAAIVIHSQPGDVDAVMVDGIMRKSEGKLLPVQVTEPQHGGLTGYTPPVLGELTWSALADAVLISRNRIMKEVDRIDLAANCAMLEDAFHFNKAGALDRLP